MDRSHLIDQLARHPEVFRTMLMGLSAQETHWKPAPGKGCVLEIICHRLDEEREDFRARLRSTLKNPEQPWPKIDPPAWVTERNYLEQDFNLTLQSFLANGSARSRGCASSRARSRGVLPVHRWPPIR